MSISLLPFVFFSLLPTLTHSISQSKTSYHVNNQHHANNLSPKSRHFTVYLQETFNKTAYFIVKGVAGPKGAPKLMSSSFGSLAAFNDPITETADPSSKRVGNMEGSSVITSFDGQRMTTVSRTNLNLKGYEGALLNVGIGDFVEVSEYPLVGGTGDFRFVQGYMTTSVVARSGPRTTYKVDFHVYWPPFAALAH